MGRNRDSIVEGLASEAIRLGADALDIEYKGGCEQVFAVKDSLGHGIATFPSSSPEDALLRKELYGLQRRHRRVTVGDTEYNLRVRVYDSFGEDAFHVELRRRPQASKRQRE